GAPLQVSSATENQVLAQLPPSVVSGTYLLSVSRGPSAPQNCLFDVAIGAVGPKGEKGDKGDQGDRGPGTTIVTPPDSGLRADSGPDHVTLSVAPGGITNRMLQNDGIHLLTGGGLSGGGFVPLGGSITLSSNAVQSISAVPPLFSSGGTNPVLS